MRFGFFSVQDYHPELGVSPRDYFELLLERMRYAEALGYESFWLAEHHFANYGLDPAPAVVLAAAARETQRLRLGTAISVLPFHNPLHVAESYALVDLLSNGRLNFGAGSGYLKHEFAGHGVPQEEKAARFDEALEIVLRAWTGERFSYQGRFHTVHDVQIQVRPLQQPRPPVWIATLRPEGAYHIGRKGFWLMGVPYVTVPQLADLRAVIESYQQGYREAGHAPAEADIVMALHVYVGETEEAAERDARAALERYIRTRLYAKGGDWDGLRAAQLVAIGNPDTVARVVETLRATGATHLICLMDFGGLEHRRVLRSMELFQREVLPRFAPLAAAPA
jgi:alkanesulfonate monooxygenase SsuD/methylene tetrahydromethanopterin reductase-like flavin-dependent oxidoreductase (luciferase family)